MVVLRSLAQRAITTLYRPVDLVYVVGFKLNHRQEIGSY